jgi:hypothetical protein
VNRIKSILLSIRPGKFGLVDLCRIFSSDRCIRLTDGAMTVRGVNITLKLSSRAGDEAIRAELDRQA